MPVIGPTVIARSAIEIASGAWWLMEPGIGVRRRVCRELALSLTSARRAKQIAEEFQASGFPLGQEITEASQQEAVVLQRITDPGYHAAVGILADDRERAGQAGHRGDRRDVQGSTACFRSGPVRLPHLLGRDTRRDLRPDELHGPGVTSDGSTLLHWHLSPDVLDSTIQLAIAAFREAYQRINKVMGWGKLEGDLWEIKLRKIYNS
jgi:hypothetical protein